MKTCSCWVTENAQAFCPEHAPTTGKPGLCGCPGITVCVWHKGKK